MGCWGGEMGGGGVVEFGMFSGLFEVVDLVWRLLMDGWMEQLLGDGTRWNIYIYSCSDTFSLSLSSPVSLSLSPSDPNS